MEVTVEKLEEGKKTFWETTKTIASWAAKFGAGVAIGAMIRNCSSTGSKENLILSIAKGIGILGFADFCAEKSAAQIEKKVDEIHMISDGSEEFVDTVAEKIKKLKEKPAEENIQEV